MSARQEIVLRRLFSEGQRRAEEGISARPYGKIADVSPATATRDLVTMDEKGVLVRSGEGGRSTRYYLNLRKQLVKTPSIATKVKAEGAVV